LKAELEAAAVYEVLAGNEADAKLRSIFEQLVESELGHARKWAVALGIDKSLVASNAPFWKLFSYKIAIKLCGTKSVVSWLVRFETKEVEDYISDPEAADLLQDERHHLRILNRLVNDDDDVLAIREKGYSGIADGGRLRAAVLGINDGLVSNFCLVMGVSGGIDQQEFILIAGVAGLLAGAFSMAAGEYVSMRSQRDIYEYRLNTEKDELEQWPEDQLNDIKLIYKAKGFSDEESKNISSRLMSNSGVALETLAREKLGLDPSELGSPWGSAISSFIAFFLGAAIPILPFVSGIFVPTMALGPATAYSALMSGVALLFVGGAIAVNSRKSIVWGGVRMLLAGGIAASVTYGIGNLVGIGVNW
jgi:VIT1/CCC1 family predicted Fe2+/Mn2+ transporter